MRIKTLFAQCIYQSPHVQVFQNYFFRWLTFRSSAIQTLLSRKNPRKPQLRYLKPILAFLIPQKGSICLLGLGGGAIIHALTPFLKIQDNTITAIEKEREVIDIAKRFFSIKESEHCKIIEESAENFIQKTDQYYDFIIVDLYTHNQYPQKCADELFFKGCKRILKANGTLIINLANPKDYKTIYLQVKQCFPTYLMCQIKGTGNSVIFARDTGSPQDLLDAIQGKTTHRS